MGSSGGTRILSGITLGRVYQVYPEANMVDILLFNGSLLPRVQVMAPYASSRSGVANLPIPNYRNGSMLDRDLPLQSANKDESDVFAIVAFFGGAIIKPIVLGFLFPEENELLCGRTDEQRTDTTKGNSKGGMFLWKHFSNVYTRVAEDGEIEISHPSGLLIKIGSYDNGKEAEDQRTIINNYDKKLRPFSHLDPETGEQTTVPTIHIYHPSGTFITLDPSGNAEVKVKGDLTETIEGNVTRTIKGDLDETVEGDITQDCLGSKTETVNDTWERKSNTSIKDQASTIDHNG